MAVSGRVWAVCAPLYFSSEPRPMADYTYAKYVNAARRDAEREAVGPTRKVY